MAANDYKSYEGSLKKLVDQYSNSYYRSIDKKAIDIDYSALNEEIEINPKSPKFEVGIIVRVTKTKNILLQYLLILC